MLPEIHQEMRSRKKISGHSDRVLAQNFDAVLAGIVIWAGDNIFAFIARGCRNTFQDTHKGDADSGTQVYTF